jgi:hypothetical protein
VHFGICFYQMRSADISYLCVTLSPADSKCVLMGLLHLRRVSKSSLIEIYDVTKIR